ncbi:MAG: hypothetical protein HWQ35_15835 [Nostoc sp. NMS1]|nr:MULTISPECIES: hypothetical protein [unclassified Nostoc]MBN3907967.1 hypothetical protein [Nostoc sp. NMS1]MBN3989445.1 hypothetical protein [Nostoc sp. NMS2]
MINNSSGMFNSLRMIRAAATWLGLAKPLADDRGDRLGQTLTATAG